MRSRPLVDTCDTCSCVSRTRLERQKMGAQIIPDNARPTQATGGNAQVKVNGGATTSIDLWRGGIWAISGGQRRRRLKACAAHLPDELAPVEICCARLVGKMPSIGAGPHLAAHLPLWQVHGDAHP